MNLDIRTLAVLLSIVSFIEALVIFFQYLLNKTYRGIGYWAVGLTLMAVAFVLIIMRDIIAISLISIVVANSLHFLGIILLYAGIRHFLGREVYWGGLIATLGAFIAAVFYFTYWDNDVSRRSVAIAVFIAGLSFRIAYVLFTNKLKYIKFSAHFIAVLLLVLGCFFILRVIAILAGSTIDSYFAPTWIQIFMFLVALVVLLLLTFGLVIMVNQRLNAEIKETQESFERIFNTSPDAAVISRIQDNCIINVNNGFTSLTGLTREAAMGKTSVNLNLWNDSADFQAVSDAMIAKGHCDNYGAVFKRKDGSLFFGLLSAKMITLQGRLHVASFTRDISERKQAEEMLKAERERLQKALEEVKTLRGILPICANCKKIRDDRGYWNQVEQYVCAHSEAAFSHSICPDCIEKLYPEYSKNNSNPG